jgi:glycosyltransferase involved in cell wall biosynthesis
MQIWGVSVIRNEADVIELTARHLLEQGVDCLLVADNLSTDATRSILDRLARELPVRVVDDPDPAHRHSEKMTSLAGQAAALGADWIVPFDGDEIWRARRGSLRDAIERASGDVLVATMFDHYPRPTFRRGSLIKRMPWNRVNGWSKVAFRWQPGTVVVMGNHDVSGVECTRVWGELIVDHYPFRSWEQYREKMRHGAKALDLAGTPAHLAPHWRRIGAMPDWRIRLSWWGRRLQPKLRLRDRALQ